MSKIHKALQKAEMEKREKTTDQKEEYEPTKEFSADIDQRVVTLSDPESLTAEQFRKLKTSILINAGPNGDGIRCVLITSSAIMEGKTLIATNLAISIAQEVQQHVLLIDADLRQPSVHKTLGITMGRGLSDYLSGDIELSQILVKTAIPKLSVLPAGKPTSEPAELLSSQKMRSLINEVRSRYDDRYIIIDSTPIMSTVEPDILAQQVDGIVFVVKAGKTPREIIQRSLSRLDKNKILGLVLNQVDFQPTGHDYQYYRYYAYGRHQSG